ncbi:MAG: pyridoxamine 5'-phosphate oxidase family protein [Chloroflexi bacterium]|nr:pyridoxamine 5'-phosphate oxidase family protein [Chloroflexota bacterium]MDA1147221.1 pyridoxamine 5'-phosphate oxidase family protein [Chloroflexota bacterium]
MSQELLDKFLQQPFVGVIATLREDGRPYTVPIWWLWHEDAIWITGTTSRVWCKQLKRDPRASLCIEAGAPMPGHVGIDGTVTAHELPEFDIWPISRMLAEKYVGRGDRANAEAVDKFFDNMRTEPRMLFRLEPEVWRAIDMSVYRGKRADREHQERVTAEG